jgi:hypothetical protein
MTAFTNIVTALAKMISVEVLRVTDPQPGKAASVVVATAEQAATFALALAKYNIDATPASYAGKHFVFVA